MSKQTAAVVAAMPGDIHQLVERTGYPLKNVLAFIALARIEGHRITAVPGPGNVTVFAAPLDTERQGA